MINLSDAVNPEWPKPQPLTASIDPIDYPTDALPDTVRNAVTEAQSFIKAPVSMVACSALGALSAAIQAHADVRRAERLEAPSSLFFMVLADSGERKTTCDSFFTKAIRDYEAEQEKKAQPVIEKYDSDMDAWSAERDGIIQAIKSAAKANKPTTELRNKLESLQHYKPKPPRIPKILLGDQTPENLAWRLAKEWPTGAVISSEAGLFLGAHGMGKDSVMRNLALYNVLWDGGSHSIGRRTSESFTVRGARLTVGLQIQEAALREFFDKSGALARGIGFFARFLIAWPVSTQGNRLFTAAPESWPYLSAFNKRMSQILQQDAPIDEHGCLNPALLKFTPEAQGKWVEFHDEIELMLKNGCDLYDVRDVAAKAADNAARLSALFHVFSNGTSGSISAESFDSASLIVAWHLHESRRFFGELALPPEMADAARLDSFLISHCKRENTHTVNKRFTQQHGPLRKKERFEPAINELCALDRLNVRTEGKQVILRVNPLLLDQ